MAQLLLPISRFGFVLAICMGFLLFSADAAHVVGNPAFQAKLLLIARRADQHRRGALPARGAAPPSGAPKPPAARS